MIKRHGVRILALAIALVSLAAMGYAAADKVGHGPFGRGPDWVINRLDQQVKDLDLTKDQQAKYDQLKTKMKARMEQGRRQHLQVRQEMKELLALDKPDMNAAAAMVKSQLGQMEQRLTEGLDEALVFYNSLNDHQKKIVAAKIKDHMDRFEKRRFCDKDNS